MVEQCFDRCAVASLCTNQLREKVEGFVGGIMNHHESKREIGTAWSKVQVAGTSKERPLSIS